MGTKNKKTIETTTNNKVYKMALYDLILGCPICAPNRGCNRNRNYDNSWKSYRKTQWKD
jgi:hypothetical protein